MDEILNQEVQLFIYNNGIVNEKGDLLDFKSHYFLWDILDDYSPRQVYKKAAQIGMTVTMVIKALHAAKYKKLGIIYTLPSDSDIEEFVPSKVDKIIRRNPCIKELLTKDNTYMKGIGDRFVHFKGTKSKSAPISTTADLIIMDEVDRSDQKTLEFYGSRLGASLYRGIWKLSNPSTAGNGVDADWRDSDQKEWVVKCQSEHEQHLVWEKNVDEQQGIYICSECKIPLRKIDIMRGKWVKQKPDVTDMSGYHISQMMCTWIDCKELVKEKKTKGDEYFYNFVLGEPYQPGDNPISRYLITDNLVAESVEKDGCKYYLGVDVGAVKHYILATEYGVCRAGTFTDWEFLADMIKTYRPTTVIDSNPYHEIVKGFVRQFPNTYMAQVMADKVGMETWEYGDMTDENKRGIIFVQRNKSLDRMIDYLLRGELLFSSSIGTELTEIVKHFLTLKKVKVQNSLGIEKYEWQSSTGVDHFCFSLLYLIIAMQRTGKSTFMNQEKNINKQAVIQRLLTPEEVAQHLAEDIEATYGNY